MTVSTSTAGTSYSSGGTNISSSYSSSYYQLKYNQQINFSCDNTTRMAVYSSARNNTSPLLIDLSASNNYSSSSFFRYDYQDNSTSLTYTNFELICVNIKGNNNISAGSDKKTSFFFTTPKRFTISYRNTPNVNSTANNTPIPSASIIGATAQGTEI